MAGFEGFEPAVVDGFEIDRGDIVVFEDLAGDAEFPPAFKGGLVGEFVDAFGGAGDELFADTEQFQHDERGEHREGGGEFVVLLRAEYRGEGGGEFVALLHAERAMEERESRGDVRETVEKFPQRVSEDPDDEVVTCGGEDGEDEEGGEAGLQVNEIGEVVDDVLVAFGGAEEDPEMPGGVEEAADAGGAAVAIERSGEARAGKQDAEGGEGEDADQEEDRRVAEIVLDFLNAPFRETALDLFVPEVEGGECEQGKVEQAGGDDASEEGNHRGYESGSCELPARAEQGAAIQKLKSSSVRSP